MNKTLTIATKIHTHNDLVKAFSESLGREIKYVQLPYDVVKMDKGVPERQIDGAIDLYEVVNADLPIFSNPERAVHFKSITGSDPLTVQQWVETVANGFN